MRTYLALFLGMCVVAVTGCNEQTLNRYTPASQYEYTRPHHPGSVGPGPAVGTGVNAYQAGIYQNSLSQENITSPQITQPQSTQVLFSGPAGATIRWDVAVHGAFDSAPLVCPGRQNFPQGGIFRLKLTDIPGHPGVELYPTLEVAPAQVRTQAFLAHSMLPVNLTEEDINQVLSGNFVTKVIYLPDPEFQELALAAGTPDTLVSTRLDPGVDPITEADRRGSVLGIVRIGNKDITADAAAAGGAVVSDTTAAGQPVAGMDASGTLPKEYISGVTGPEYGKPFTSTTSGIPGPVSIPQEDSGRRPPRSVMR